MNRDPHHALDRRSGTDRRQREQGAPDGHERRVGLEPRRPEVHELSITPSQWAALQDGDTVPMALDEVAPTVPDALDEADTVPAALSPRGSVG